MTAIRMLLIVCCMLFSALGKADTIVVVIPAASSLTDEFIEDLRKQRSDDNVSVYNLESGGPVPEASLLITMGSSSLQWRLKQVSDTPTIGTYISRSSLPPLSLPPIPDYLQIILANPAPHRQLQLVRLLIPRLSAVGALYSPDHQAQLPEWQQAADAADLDLLSLPLDNQQQLGRQLITLLDGSDALVAIDDPIIYNADSLKTILLSSYTRNKVLIGPSAPFINAGSLSTTFSTPGQTAQSITRVLARPWRPGAITYPHYFSVLSNAQVARSLGFPPPDDDALAEQLRQQEMGQ